MILIRSHATYFTHVFIDHKFITYQAVMAEWLRRLTRNQMGSSRVGSNPTHSVISFCWNFTFYVLAHKMSRGQLHVCQTSQVTVY